MVHGRPVGLQLYSLRQLMPKDVPGTLALIRSIGFREIEGGGDYGLGMAGFLAEVKKAGLSMTSALYGYEDWGKDTAAVVKRASDYGVRYTGLSWIPHKDAFTREDCLKAAENFNRWGAAAKAAGIRFVYHIHGYEFEPSPKARSWTRSRRRPTLRPSLSRPTSSGCAGAAATPSRSSRSTPGGSRSRT